MARETRSVAIAIASILALSLALSSSSALAADAVNARSALDSNAAHHQRQSPFGAGAMAATQAGRMHVNVADLALPHRHSAARASAEHTAKGALNCGTHTHTRSEKMRKQKKNWYHSSWWYYLGTV